MVSGGDVHAGDARRKTGVDRDRFADRRRPDIGHAVLDRPAAVRRQQLGDAVGRDQRDRRVGAALEPLGGLGRQLVAAFGAEDGDRVPVGGLDEDVGRGLGQLGGLAAHHTGEADRSGVVGDQQVLGGELSVGSVERGHPFARTRSSYDDRAGELVAVVAVDRLAQLEHHVVGDVDRQRDRPHARELDAAGHPVRRRRRGVEARHRSPGEHRAADGVLDDDVVRRLVRRRFGPVGGVAELDAVGEGGLAADTAQREGIGTIGVDLELDDLVAQWQHVEDVVAGLAGAGRQHDDAAPSG